MFGERKGFDFADRGSQEKQEQPVRMVNVMEVAGHESLQHLEGHELTGKEAVDVDTRALRESEAPNVCFGRPHAGEFVPENLLKRMSPDVIKNSLSWIDKGTDSLFRSEHIPSGGTKISRFIVDPNRHPIPGESLRAGKRAPGNVVWEKGVDGLPLYLSEQQPTAEEVRVLTEQFYLPYYHNMMGLVGSLADRRKSKEERLLLIDGHSFPGVGPFSSAMEAYMKQGYDPNFTIDQMPMFVVGDLEGSSCDEDIRLKFREVLERKFQELSEHVREALQRNIPGELLLENFQFKGVHNVDFWSGFDGARALGREIYGVNALQLECNEAAYCNEDGTYNKELMYSTRTLIESVAREVSDYLKGK
jgi:N-formylglutamate amidohydrolase